MDIEKIKETLKANGIDEETIAKIVADLEKEAEPKEEAKEPSEGEQSKEDESQGEGEPAEGEPTPNPDEGQPEDNPSENNEGEPSEEGEQPQEGEVPPVPNPEEIPTEVPQEEVPPTEETPVPPVPPFDPTELLGKMDEMGKTIEGLLSRIGSLEDALKGAGVLEKSDSENIGFENQGLPGSSSVGADEAMVSALAKLNGHR